MKNEKSIRKNESGENLFLLLLNESLSLASGRESTRSNCVEFCIETEESQGSFAYLKLYSVGDEGMGSVLPPVEMVNGEGDVLPLSIVEVLGPPPVL